MQIDPIVIVPDITRIVLASAVLYYLKKLEDIKCLVLPSWKPRFLRNFLYFVIAAVIVSMFISHSLNIPKWIKGMVITIINVLFIAYIWTLYTYVRELEANFKNCNLSYDVKYVHEFIKLYSLILMIGLVIVIISIISTILSFIPFPKYVNYPIKKSLAVSVSRTIGFNNNNNVSRKSKNKRKNKN